MCTQLDQPSGGQHVLLQRKDCVYALLNELQSFRVQATLLACPVKVSQRKRRDKTLPFHRCSANSHLEQVVVATLQQAT